MQDVTDLRFWRLLGRYGHADAYVTEYIRVYPHSRVDKEIQRDILHNDTGCPVIAQIAGEDIPSLARIAEELQRLPVAGIDLNLGCPAQVVCRKHVGGALLKDLGKVDEILSALRAGITAVPFSVKCRLGYEDTADFEKLLELFSRHRVDWVTIHGRTVRQGYGGRSDWQMICRAAESLSCPVVGNGDISDPVQAARMLEETRLSGLMIGRGAVRNPWIFRQIRQARDGEPVTLPTGREVLAYLHAIKEMTSIVEHSRGESAHVERSKKFLNFIGAGISGEFLYRTRRAQTWTEMESAWKHSLDMESPYSLILEGEKASY
ncbi:MAG: tRNA-dihydrouridine synthase family protein [Verrucomicrobia bacterium]|nr:tRNA-dihydrouridine synthase family protein [Verrucomicrobiota bacterium]